LTTGTKDVHDTFVNAAPATAEHAADPAPRDTQRFRLLSLVRALITFGQELTATLQGRNTPAPPPDVARRFGCVNLTLIIARITRGLMIAAALEKRLLRPAPPAPPSQSPRTEPRPPAPPRPARSANQPPRQPPPDEAQELLGTLPSAREIAARIRKQRTGAVLIDICRDLGIDAEHPLWRTIADAIRAFGGNMVKMIRIWHRQTAETIRLALPPGPDPRFDQVLASLRHPP